MSVLGWSNIVLLFYVCVQCHMLIGATDGIDSKSVQLQQRTLTSPNTVVRTKPTATIINQPKPKAVRKEIPKYPPADKPILHLLNGTLMHEIKSCPHSSSLKPENIHVVTLASPHYFQDDNSYSFSLQTVAFYTKLHGYPYHVVNPVDVMNVHGHIRPDDRGGEIICAKSLVMLCKSIALFVLLLTCVQTKLRKYFTIMAAMQNGFYSWMQMSQ